MINNRIMMVTAYLLGVFFLYPIVVHILMNDLNMWQYEIPDSDFWYFIQVFISHWGLISVGSFLAYKYGFIKINKILGILFIIIGIYWLYRIIEEYIKLARGY